MWNWLSLLWCKWLVAWRMRNDYLLWHLWSLNFVMGWEPIFQLLMSMKCLNILYKISHMRNASSNGELLTITTTMMGSMKSTVFLKELKGSSKGYHFFVLANVCLFVFYLWWIPMLKSQDGSPFCFHDSSMFYMFFHLVHNFFPTLYHDFGVCITLLYITLLYIYRLTWCDIKGQLSWRGLF